MGFMSRLWLGQSKTFNRFLLSFLDGFALVFWVIVLLHNPIMFKLQLVGQWLDVLLQYFLIDGRMNSSIYYAKWPRSWRGKTIPTPVCYHYTVGMTFYSWNPELFFFWCNWAHILQKEKFSAHPSRERCPKTFGGCLFLFFFVNTRQAILVLWNSSVFCLATLPWMPFCPVSLYSEIIIGDMNCWKWGLQFFGCPTGFFHYYSDEPATRGVVLVVQPLMGRFSTVLWLLHLEIKTLTVVQLSPRALEMFVYFFPDWSFCLSSTGIHFEFDIVCCLLTSCSQHQFA